jgi:hypothetical protein
MADWGPEQIKGILDAVAHQIPDVLNNLGDVLYSKENAEKYGHAVASFYKQLVDAGMLPDQAFELTQRYMSSLSPMQSLSQAFAGRGEKGSRHDSCEENE